MDLGRSFSYIFDDEDWVTKVLLTALISVIPILNLALYGWIIELMRNMLDGQENPLPYWDNFGRKFTDGLMFLVASLIYNIFIVLALGAFGVVASLVDPRGAEVILSLLGCVLVVFILGYLVIANAGLFIGMVRYARNPTMAVYLAIGENLRLALANAGTLATLVLFLVIVSLILAVFGWIPCIGWLAALALGTPVYGHLIGQAAILIVGRSKAKRGLV